MTLRTILPLAFVAASQAAPAASHHVYPAPGALQAAIDAAAPGDRVWVHENPGGGGGVYAEAIMVDKPLHVVGVGRVFVTASCTGAVPATVAADGVLLKRLHVTGASGPYAIDVQDRDDVRLDKLWTGAADASVPGSDCLPTVALGNVERSANVRIRRTFFYVPDGDPPIAGLRLAEIAAGAAVSILRSDTFYIEALIVDSGAGAALGDADIVLRGNGFGGLRLVNSDGVRIVGNGSFSISLDAGSDNNLIVGNSLSNGGTDQGAGNCWRGNRTLFGTVPGCP